MAPFIVFFVFLVLSLTSNLIECKRKVKKFNVMSFGAIGNSHADDTQAFEKAWDAACGGDQPQGITPLVQVPLRKIFLVKQISFNGPCKSPQILFQIRGRIVAPISTTGLGVDPSSWITFSNVNGLTVRGNGFIDGRGSEWWKKAPTDEKPTTLTFSKCENLVVDGTKHVNSQRNHISIEGCENVVISNISIVAPETSPNTDGIDISHSKYVHIRDSFIGTGDDCIAIGTANSFINITSVYCGPGHGISIGSLGRNGATDTVEEIHVKNVTFDKTQNGARIKTWQGGNGYAKKITFEDVILIDTNQPIIVDQYYCPHRNDCPTHETNAVQISDVSFVRFRGTSNSKEAVILNCSESVACTNIYLDGINIEEPKEKCESSCINAHGKCGSIVSPKVTCLLD